MVKKWYLDYGYAQVGYVGEEYLVNITLLTPICAICLGAIDSCITNLLGFIGLYKFHMKFDFYRFVQTSHEFHVMANMNYIFTYFYIVPRLLLTNHTCLSFDILCACLLLWVNASMLRCALLCCNVKVGSRLAPYNGIGCLEWKQTFVP